MNSRSPWAVVVVVVLILCAIVGGRARALQADQLLLIVNKNVPAGVDLAKHYAQKRGVPDGRILELDLPTGDDLTFEEYETKVFPAVRTFLLGHKLGGQVKCAVTFYGVPLRVKAHQPTAAETAEMAELQTELARVTAETRDTVGQVEALAKRSDPTFAPKGAPDDGLDQLSVRSDAAAAVVFRHVAGLKDAEAREQLAAVVGRAIDPIVGKAGLAERQLIQIAQNPKPTAEERAAANRIRGELQTLQAKFAELQTRRADPAARAELRRLAKELLGPFEYGHALTGILGYLDPVESESAVDSELALLWWNFPVRSRWQGNALNYRFRGHTNPVLMAMRIDGPTPEGARRLIDDSIAVEEKGLSGRVVIDSGGHLGLDPKQPAYRAYDDTLRRLADLLKAKTKLGADLAFDEKKEVLPPNSVDGVAAYVGWYAMRNYTPACAFVPGAVGYHIASYEMVSLHNPGERGWCRGLLSDGVVATLGPETEPFLSAFPAADEFFPLLMTGKLTLAEVYWKTTPMTSWRISMVGDPLYRPYKVKPLVAVEDLPEGLRGAVGR